MSGLTRRELLTGGLGAGAAVTTSAVDAQASATSEPTAPANAVAMLFDTTRCIGCQACVAACTEANGLIPDTSLTGGLQQRPLDLNSRTKNIIKLCTDTKGGASFVKRQCMHCLEPACVAGCPFGALTKGDKGVVGWNPSQCIGCRYCEVACPFDVPKFEWEKFNPKIVKCEFCREQRLAVGEEPACTAACPVDAVIFGTRDDLLADAHDRIKKKPNVYVENRVYGEKEAGGTQVLYLSHLPFESIGLPKLSPDARPGRELRFQMLLYKFMLIPLALYALIAGIIRKRWKAHDAEVKELEEKHGLPEQL